MSQPNAPSWRKRTGSIDAEPHRDKTPEITQEIEIVEMGMSDSVKSW